MAIKNQVKEPSPNLASALGRLLIAMGDYAKKHPARGYNTLKNLLGEKVIYKQGRLWFYGTLYLKELSIEQLDALTDKVQKKK